MVEKKKLPPPDEDLIILSNILKRPKQPIKKEGG